MGVHFSRLLIFIDKKGSIFSRKESKILLIRRVIFLWILYWFFSVYHLLQINYYLYIACVFRRISFLILFVPFKIIKSLLGHSQQYYEHQRSRVGKQKSDFQHRDKLWYTNRQIKEIEKVFKLLVQHLWEKCKNRVQFIT